MMKWNLIVDVARCHNSQNCYLSVVDEYAGNEYPGYTAEMPLHGHKWIEILKRERGRAPMVDVAYMPTTCNHCDDAPCITAAENNAVKKRNDGIVLIDPEKAKGQKQLVDACPYGAIWWNEEKDVPQHWNFDAHLLDRGWKQPRCVQACPTGALRSVFAGDDEMAVIAKRDQLEVRSPELGTRPRVYYRNMGLYSKCFIGGSIAGMVRSKEECIEGAVVVLNKDGAKVAELSSDEFGDFKFDGLDPGSGAYTVEIRHPDYQSVSETVSLGGTSIYLGLVSLQAR